MNDIRLKIINLVLLSIYISFARDNKLWVIFILCLLYISLLREAFLSNLRLITLIAGILCLFALSLFFFSTLELSIILTGLIRFTALTIIAVILFQGFNLLGFIAALHQLKIPVSIAIAFGVGFRFIPVFLQEIPRILFVLKQSGLGFNLKSIKKHGLINISERMIVPLIILVLRKAESVSISIAVQQIHARIISYKFAIMQLPEILFTVTSVALVASLLFNV